MKKPCVGNETRVWMMSPAVPSKKDKQVPPRVSVTTKLVDRTEASMMELTTSSLREYHNVENWIVEAITHGTPSIIAAGFARSAMMYLYTIWDIRWAGTGRLNTVHVETRTASNSQSFMDRIKCPIVKCQRRCKPKQEGPNHRAATWEEHYIITSTVLGCWLTKLFIRRESFG